MKKKSLILLNIWNSKFDPVIFSICDFAAPLLLEFVPARNKMKRDSIFICRLLKALLLKLAMKSQEDVVFFFFLFICRDSLSFFSGGCYSLLFLSRSFAFCVENGFFFFFVFICRDSLPFVRWQWKRGRPGVLCHFLASPPVAPNIRGLSWPWFVADLMQRDTSKGQRLRGRRRKGGRRRPRRRCPNTFAHPPEGLRPARARRTQGTTSPSNPTRIYPEKWGRRLLVDICWPPTWRWLQWATE